ncbi:tRNA adenosine(34) deaminase TadA [Candidatus Uabimicrobium sp. HlEnr_7]|uniref:tRNA adenosine(34) deaminase TadA n=1 Tax=Candidatus Uabimicrobium helgolandensis TaxID=3095367 RepID=UPI00355639AB
MQIYNATSDDIHKKYMLLALEEAKTALKKDEVPVGAVVVKDGEVIGRGHNQRETLQSPTAHAEILAVNDAAQYLGAWRLNGCSVYVTMEPCAMCAGALVLSRISTVVFSLRDSKGGACGTVFNVTNEPKLNHAIEVVAGVCYDESLSLIQNFFREKRKKNK